MTYRGIVAVLLCFAVSVTALAHDPAEVVEEPAGPWSGEVSLGYLSSSGNSESSSGTAQFRVGYVSGAWEHTLSGRAFGSSEDKTTTAENYKAAWNSAYNFDARNYAFGTLDYNKNRFSGYPRQIFAVVGYGRRVIDTEKIILNLEIGAGYADQKKYLTDLGGATEDEDGAVARLGGDFVWNFSEYASFQQLLTVSAASANTYWESVSKLGTTIIGNLALGLSYTIQTNTDVAPGVEKSDRFSAVTLDYAF